MSLQDAVCSHFYWKCTLEAASQMDGPSLSSDFT